MYNMVLGSMYKIHLLTHPTLYLYEANQQSSFQSFYSPKVYCLPDRYTAVYRYTVDRSLKKILH